MLIQMYVKFYLTKYDTTAFFHFTIEIREQKCSEKKKLHPM